MAHNITANDKQQGTSMGWHKLTEVMERINLRECWLSQWDVEPRRLFSEKDGKYSPSKYHEFHCTDDDSIIVGQPFEMVETVNGVTVGSYQPIFNKDFLNLIEKSIGGAGHEIVSVGSVANRARIFVTVRLNALKDYVAGGRAIEPYLNFLSSHDTSNPLIINTSNTMTICENTFMMNLHHRGSLVNAKIEHRQNAEVRLANLPSIIDAACGVQAQFAAEFNKLSQQPTTVKWAQNFYAGFIGRNIKVDETVVPEDNELKSWRKKIEPAEMMTTLFQSGKGNRGETFGDVFSGATDYLTHYSLLSRSSKKTRGDQFFDSEFGKGRNEKNLVFDILKDEKSREETAAHGNLLYNMTAN